MEDLYKLHLHKGWDPGLLSFALKTLVTMCDLYPNKVYVDWMQGREYQNLHEPTNLWELVWKQPDVEQITNEYNVIQMQVWNGEILKDGCISKDLYYPTDDERIKAKKLIDEKFKLRPEIKNIIDAFYNIHMKGKKVLSIHRRGCTYGPNRGKENISDTQQYTDEVFNKNLLNVIQTNDFDLAFIVSDNKESKDNVITFVENLGLKTVSYDSQIAIDSKSYGIMYDELPFDGNLLVKEIVIETYLMSMAHSIYMGGSGVTVFALFLNPELKDYHVVKK